MWPRKSGFRTEPMSSFWHDRLVEGGLILSLALYYIVGNQHTMIGYLGRLNPLLSLPFLLIFAVFCWYRLPFAVALLPLWLPYYLLQKVVVSHYAFSMAEITLWTCIAVAALQFCCGQRSYRLSWSQVREGLGPFILPIVIFFLMAAVSVVIAYAHNTALRAFREEVLDPLLYLGLVLLYLRKREDVLRLLIALVGSALLVGLLGMAQYFFFKNIFVLEDGIRRVHAVYGSANSIGLFFDYILPIAFALLIAGISWRNRVLAAIVCLPLLFVLYLTQSRGAWLANAIGLLFVIAFSLCDRNRLLIACVALLVLLASMLLFFHRRSIEFLLQGHVSKYGISTVTKRLYLWQRALRMIHDSPWLGYGMDNWLCHYSKNAICAAHTFHYWIVADPTTGKPTGLLDEPTLSHPHNIFLHVWVSIGLFGLLAFIAHHADQAFVQDVVALHLGRAVPRDQRIGKQRDRIAALVLHPVFDREQIMVVDRDGAAEFQALAVVEGQRHRMLDAERARARLLPHGVGGRHRDVGAGGVGPAEFGVERFRAAGGRRLRGIELL